jgi:hypothetical protein
VQALRFLPICSLLACGAGTTGTDEETGVESDSETGEDLASRPGCTDPGTPGATAGCLLPTMPPEYYVQEAEAYFDTLDTSASRDSVPNYHPQVARWEWPPWLLLTAYGKTPMIEGNDALREIDPSTVPVRDCRFFEHQPFARCYVDFDYEVGTGPCAIYEEFTFNDAGKMTFIEAWSDLPGLLPNAPDDRWAEDPEYPRLANKVPGLGNATGTIDLESEWMMNAAAEDPDVAEFALRASDWFNWWLEALENAPEDFFAVGCNWD